MNETIRCLHCRSVFERNPRIKTQRYCARKECQRARKRQWQREKLLSDPDYKANQRDCQKAWHNRHPGYYKAYRKRHPAKAQRNRLLQHCRNSRRSPGKRIAKMDALIPWIGGPPQAFYMLPVIAKMDAFPEKVFLIPAR
ncbi:conserved hypothetical protein [uncultured Desulfatiglans sp.]|nr:conserved hypothetical protein [uncultured Desulfatiglans sp.]